MPSPVDAELSTERQRPPSPTGRAGGGYWRRPPADRLWEVPLATEFYLFDRPIYKRDLAADPDFADALVVKMPRTRNPIPLTRQQWGAVATRLPRGAARSRARKRPSASAGDVVVTERPLGTKVQEATYQTAEAQRKQQYSEFRLVKAYEEFLRYPLFLRGATLPSGERIAADAYDRVEHRLIEAKASASRPNIRMATGQLLDYVRHIAPGAALAVLLPEVPTADLLDLLHSQRIDVIAPHGKKFRTV
jgi:hypothetical protein